MRIFGGRKFNVNNVELQDAQLVSIHKLVQFDQSDDVDLNKTQNEEREEDEEMEVGKEKDKNKKEKSNNNKLNPIKKSGSFNHRIKTTFNTDVGRYLSQNTWINKSTGLSKPSSNTSFSNSSYNLTCEQPSPLASSSCLRPRSYHHHHHQGSEELQGVNNDTSNYDDELKKNKKAFGRKLSRVESLRNLLKPSVRQFIAKHSINNQKDYSNSNNNNRKENNDKASTLLKSKSNSMLLLNDKQHLSYNYTYNNHKYLHGIKQNDNNNNNNCLMKTTSCDNLSNTNINTTTTSNLHFHHYNHNYFSQNDYSASTLQLRPSTNHHNHHYASTSRMDTQIQNEDTDDVLRNIHVGHNNYKSTTMIRRRPSFPYSYIVQQSNSRQQENTSSTPYPSTSSKNSITNIQNDYNNNDVCKWNSSQHYFNSYEKNEVDDDEDDETMISSCSFSVMRNRRRGRSVSIGDFLHHLSSTKEEEEEEEENEDDEDEDDVNSSSQNKHSNYTNVGISGKRRVEIEESGYDSDSIKNGTESPQLSPSIRNQPTTTTTTNPFNTSIINNTFLPNNYIVPESLTNQQPQLLSNNNSESLQLDDANSLNKNNYYKTAIIINQSNNNSCIPIRINNNCSTSDIARDSPSLRLRNKLRDNNGQSMSTMKKKVGGGGGSVVGVERKRSLNIFTIHFIKGENKKSLGFSFVGGIDSTTNNSTTSTTTTNNNNNNNNNSNNTRGIFIKTIFPYGQAAEDGTIHPGDEILSINGESCSHKTHSQVLELFKKVKAGPITLQIARREFSTPSSASSSTLFNCSATNTNVNANINTKIPTKLLSKSTLVLPNSNHNHNPNTLLLLPIKINSKPSNINTNNSSNNSNISSKNNNNLNYQLSKSKSCYQLHLV